MTTPKMATVALAMVQGRKQVSLPLGVESLHNNVEKPASHHRTSPPPTELLNLNSPSSHFVVPFPRSALSSSFRR